MAHAWGGVVLHELPVATYISAARDAVLGLNARYVPWMDVFRSLTVALDFRANVDPQMSWPQQIVALTLMSLGGTTLAAMLVGVQFGWLNNDLVWLSYLVAWALVKFDPLARLMSLGPLQWVCIFLGRMSWGFSVTAWGADKGMSVSLVAAFLCGILAGTGGGIMRSMFNLTSVHWRFQAPAMLVVPTYHLLCTVSLAFVYALLLHIPVYWPWLCTSMPAALAMDQACVILSDHDNAMFFIIVTAIGLGYAEPVVRYSFSLVFESEGWYSLLSMATGSSAASSFSSLATTYPHTNGPGPGPGSRRRIERQSTDHHDHNGKSQKSHTNKNNNNNNNKKKNKKKKRH